MKKLKFAYRYFLYLIKSTNAHGAHSPFVYELLQKVFYVNANYYAFQEIENFRESLLDSNESIVVTHFGASPASSPTKKIKLKDIAAIAAKPPKYGQLLFRLVNYFQPSTVLELGTSLGLSTAYLAKPNAQAKVTTIEGCPQLYALSKQHFDLLNISNIKQINAPFDVVLEDIIAKQPTLDFVFFDGNHAKAPTLKYFKACLKKANTNTVFVFDDINWSDEMREAWEEIKNNNQVTVSIDLFFMGIVFFRKELSKQHFVIRY